VIDPDAFTWTDTRWPGVAREGQVVYEMHIGTFTTAGTWQAAAQELPELARAGITVVEVLPVADFAGDFGWGYDGVDFFAPTRLYGRPEDFRAFVDRAHSVGVGVILDVVYNHFGPDGNYLGQFSADYASTRHRTDWGASINFDGDGSAAVREFFVSNAGYWIDEFHLDGLRLDATQDIHDDSPEHVLMAIAHRARARAGPRSVLLVAENEPQDARLVRPVAAGGYGLDALWNDDFHHSARVALTGRAEAYYSDYAGTPQEMISAVKRGYLYQGQRYAWQEKRRGRPAGDIAPTSFVNFIQNHDQVANSWRARGHQLTSPGQYRA
jgi:maltooligosyltrehalose trehalohydrolase